MFVYIQLASVVGVSMWSIIIILLVILGIWFVLKVYFEKYDTIIAYTGGLGSGKTFKGVQQSIKLLRKNRLKVKFYNIKTRFLNLFRKEKKLVVTEIPMLYSSIPIFIRQKRFEFKMCNLVKLKYSYWVDYNNNNNSKISRYILRSDYELMLSNNIIKRRDVSRFIESSLELTEDYLLLQKHINYKSIVFLDEIGGYVNQYEYNNPNVIYALDEFIRLFRHYSRGGYLICTEQCSDSICKPIRVRLNKVFNLMNFKGYFGLFYRVNIRELSLSEDIKTIEQQNSEDNMKVTFGLFPLRKRYDTYCYSERYNSVPYANIQNVFSELKRYTLLRVSHKKVYKPLTSDFKNLDK